MTSVQVQKDNLAIGIFLASHQHGSLLDDVLAYGLGYNPNGPYPQNDRERYENRMRVAQTAGNENYAKREAGYFTFGAQPFGNTFVYKALWYVWHNAQSHVNQAVLIASTDIVRLRERRDKDLSTRTRNVRSIRTADNVQQYREALAAGDIQRAYAIQGQMSRDDSIGEFLTNQLGIEYADIAPVIDQIAAKAPFNQIQFNFSKTAPKIRKLQADLVKEQTQFVSQISTWISVQANLPPNASVLALQDAAQLYSTL